MGKAVRFWWAAFIFFMSYIQISIEAAEAEQEILISRLSDMGASGFEQTDSSLIAYFNENTFPGYEVKQVLGAMNFNTLTLEDQNWNEVWESNFSPVTVGDFCAVRAGFHDPVGNVQHEILITPKMSFGTGHHATTYMMIAQMQDLEFRDKTVFDFGTGTGILAILAEKLGARKVEAIDVDSWSIENAAENIANNGCSRISLELSSQLPESSFDIILANINRNVILKYLPDLRKNWHDNSKVVLSGLLKSDEEAIVDAAKMTGLTLEKQVMKDNWISLLFVTGKRS